MWVFQWWAHADFLQIIVKENWMLHSHVVWNMRAHRKQHKYQTILPLLALKWFKITWMFKLARLKYMHQFTTVKLIPESHSCWTAGAWSVRITDQLRAVEPLATSNTNMDYKKNQLTKRLAVSCTWYTSSVDISTATGRWSILSVTQESTYDQRVLLWMWNMTHTTPWHLLTHAIDN